MVNNLTEVAYYPSKKTAIITLANSAGRINVKFSGIEEKSFTATASTPSGLDEKEFSFKRKGPLDQMMKEIAYIVEREFGDTYSCGSRLADLKWFRLAQFV